MINFNNHELGIIDLVIVLRMHMLQEELIKNDFDTYEEKNTCKRFLAELQNIHNKINGKEIKEND